MANLNVLAGLVGGMQGYQDYQDKQRKRQLEQIDLLTKSQQLRLEQQKADAEQALTLRSQKADENAAAVLQGIYGGANPQAMPTPPAAQPAPQQMAPGQPSVPMQQPSQMPPPQQRPPVPPQGAQGQMPPPGTPPLPQGQPPGAPQRAQAQQPQAPQQLPPYQRIDTQLAQQQGQPGTAPQVPQQPPAPDSLSFQGAVKLLQSKGVQGQALVDALDRIKPYLDQQAKQQTDALKQQLAVQKSVLDVAKFQQQGNHEAALEANANARLALEQQRTIIEANKAQAEAGARATAAVQRQQALEQSKIPNGYQRGKDGKLEPMPGGPYDPSSPGYRAPKGAAKTGTVADKMNPTMLASVRLDIQEGRQALETVKQLQAQTTGPYFAHDNASPIASLLHKELTTDQQQQYETLMNRMAVAIASVQSMGRGQISDAKVNEARKLVPQLGDTPGNRTRKIAQLNKIFDMADQTLKSPIGGNPAEPDQDREAATAGSVPGGGNEAPPPLVKFGALK